MAGDPSNSWTSSAPPVEGENDTLSNAQRSTLKWEKEEALGEMATVAPVLYTNINFPNLKEEFPGKCRVCHCFPFDWPSHTCADRLLGFCFPALEGPVSSSVLTYCDCTSWRFPGYLETSCILFVLSPVPICIFPQLISVNEMILALSSLLKYVEVSIVLHAYFLKKKKIPRIEIYYLIRSVKLGWIIPSSKYYSHGN